MVSSKFLPQVNKKQQLYCLQIALLLYYKRKTDNNDLKRKAQKMCKKGTFLQIIVYLINPKRSNA